MLKRINEISYMSTRIMAETMYYTNLSFFVLISFLVFPLLITIMLRMDYSFLEEDVESVVLKIIRAEWKGKAVIS